MRCLAELVFVSLFIMHGANFLIRKVSNEIAERAEKVAFSAWIAATVLTVAFVVWTFFATDILTKPGINGLIPAILAAVALLVTGWLIRIGEERLGIYHRFADGRLCHPHGLCRAVSPHSDLQP